MKPTAQNRFGAAGIRAVLGGLLLSVALTGCGAREDAAATGSFAMAAAPSGTSPSAPSAPVVTQQALPGPGGGSLAPAASSASSPAVPPAASPPAAVDGGVTAPSAAPLAANSKAPSATAAPATTTPPVAAAVPPAAQPAANQQPSQAPQPAATAAAKSGHSDSIKWSEFFDNEDQTTPSAKFWDMSGQTVSITGYMGEVLSFEKNWFLVIPQPGAECPFDNGDETYWNKIMMAFTGKGERLRYTSGPLRITGRLDVGIKVDESGYKTMFRIYDAQFEKLKE